MTESSSKFVVLLHKTPSNSDRASHWDLMLQNGDELETWALDEQPTVGKTISAIRLPAHRLEYLTYEGPISNDRGSVSQVIDGTWTSETDIDWDTDFEIKLSWIEGQATVQFANEEHDRWTIAVLPN